MIWLLLFLFSHCVAYTNDLGNYFVNIAQASYCVSPGSTWTCPTCNPTLTFIRSIENNGVRALHGYDPNNNAIFISFRGSVNTQNWINNMKIMKIKPYDDPEIEVDDGFYQSLSQVRSDIISSLPELTNSYKTSRIEITGHSLGAAMATLLAYEISTYYPEYIVQQLITFGSPRVGNNYFSNQLQILAIPSYRITHYYDIVPHLPEEALGYQHIPTEVWYNEDNSNYDVCNGNENPSCSNSCSPIHCTSVSDHLYYMNVTMGSDQCG